MLEKSEIPELRAETALLADCCGELEQVVSRFPQGTALAALRATVLFLDPPIPNLPRLSPREAEILHMVVQGQANKAIANTLGISEATIKVYLKTLMNKYQVNNRTKLALLAAGGMKAAA